jgi:hypothetical protein
VVRPGFSSKHVEFIRALLSQHFAQAKPMTLAVAKEAMLKCPLAIAQRKL